MGFQVEVNQAVVDSTMRRLVGYSYFAGFEGAVVPYLNM